MSDIHTINVARDFSKYPAGDTKESGPYSGQHFREDVLLPALQAHEEVIVELDGVRGYPTEWVDKAFSSLLIDPGIPNGRFLHFVSSDDDLIDEIITAVHQFSSWGSNLCVRGWVGCTPHPQPENNQ